MSRQVFSVYVLCGRWALCGRLHVVLKVGMFSVGCVCVYEYNIGPVSSN